MYRFNALYVRQTDSDVFCEAPPMNLQFPVGGDGVGGMYGTFNEDDH